VHANHKILLVEDDGGVREAIVRILRGSGYEVTAYESGEALLAQLGGAALDAGGECLVCDIRLPGLSGFELHRRLAEAGTMPPWIFITAHDDAAVRRRAEGLRAGYLLKPFEGRALLALVAQALDA
jgi:FixJ family two-component response regulator